MSSSKLVSRRSVLQSAGGFTGAAALSSLGGTSALAANDLRILMAGGSWGEWVNKTFAEPFAKAKGIEFIWKYGIGQEPVIMAQRVRPQWDLAHSSQTKSGQLLAMKLYRPWTADKVPNIEKIHPSFRYEQLVGKCHTPYGLCVNTKQIKRPIDSWFDLWDPAFKGKVAFPAWNWQGEEVFHAINIALGGTVENIEPGIAKFKTLFKDNQCKIINNVEHTKQLLVAGEVWFAPYFGARTEQAAAAGAPVEFVIPKEGGLSWIWNTALVANRPSDSMEIAETFVNTTLDAEAQISFAKLTGYPPTNMEAMRNLPPELKKLELSEEEVHLLGKLQRETDYMAMFAYRDQYVERWNKEVLQAS